MNSIALFRYLTGVMAFAFFGCQGPAEPDDPIIAKVYEDVLTRDELIAKMPTIIPEGDSARVANQIVTNWIHDKAVLNFAKENLTESQKDFTKQLDEYRNSLITYAYERELINQKLDTNVADAEIEAYYEQNIQNFKLKNYIVKLRFIKLSLDAPKQAKLERWFKSDDEKDFDKLYEYCRKYAENYYFEEDTWLYLQDVLKEVPINQEDWDNFLRKTTYYKFVSGPYEFLVRFFDYKLKEDTSPLSLEKRKIKDLILNKRKVELVKNMREDVVEESYANKKIQVYP